MKINKFDNNKKAGKKHIMIDVSDSDNELEEDMTLEESNSIFMDISLEPR